jgi:hypothetical protein
VGDIGTLNLPRFPFPLLAGGLMRSTLILALSLATTLAVAAPCGSEAAAQRYGRVHRQTRA